MVFSGHFTWMIWIPDYCVQYSDPNNVPKTSKQKMAEFRFVSFMGVRYSDPRSIPLKMKIKHFLLLSLKALEIEVSFAVIENGFYRPLSPHDSAPSRSKRPDWRRRAGASSTGDRPKAPTWRWRTRQTVCRRSQVNFKRLKGLLRFTKIKTSSSVGIFPMKNSFRRGNYDSRAWWILALVEVSFKIAVKYFVAEIKTANASTNLST